VQLDPGEVRNGAEVRIAYDIQIGEAGETERL